MRVMRRMLLSSPLVPVEATAIAMLWGEMILPAVAPMVLAGPTQVSLVQMARAVSACSELNSTLEEVALPVTKVPIEPIRGATSG